MSKIIYFDLNRFEVLVNHTLEGKVNPTYLDLIRTFTLPLFDRTKRIDPGFAYDIITPIPERDESFNMTWAECMDARARQLLDRAKREDRKIDVYWSGGIDSTGALIALLRQADESERKRIRVLFTGDSLREYPGFYETHIKNQLENACLTISVTKSLNFDNIIVTGELGDQVFGSILAVKFVPGSGDELKAHELPQGFSPDFGNLLMPWEPMIEAMLLQMANGDRSMAHRVFNLLKEQSKAAPVQIETTFDLLWWINFSLKWQDVQLRFFVELGVTPEQAGRVCHFFDDDLFQQWSMNNHDKKIRDTWLSYKWPAKDYIFEFTGDIDYRDNKEKIGSLRSAAEGRTRFGFLLDDYSLIKFGKHSINPKLFEIEHGAFIDEVFS